MIDRREMLAGLGLAGGAGVLGLSGCGRSGRAGEKVIAFSQCNNAEPYRAAQKARMEQLVGKMPGVRLVVADAAQDNSRQVAQVETFIRQRPSVLIVAPNERAALTGVMDYAMSAGIPVICLERDILKPNYSCFVRIDNREIGRLAGEFIAELLRKKNGGGAGGAGGEPRGNVVMVRGLLGVEAEINRDAGAHDVFRRYPGIRVVADPVADWIQATAKDRMTEVLRAQPAVDVVYGHNDPMAIGASLAAKELGRDRKIAFVGVDGLGGPAGGIRKVMDGVLAATFIYPLGVDEAIEVAAGFVADPHFVSPKEINLQSTLVTPANAAKLYAELGSGVAA